MGTFRDLDKGAAQAKGGTYRRLDAASSRPASFGDNVLGAVKSFERAIPFADEGLDSARAFLRTASDIATGKVEGDLRAAIRAGRNPVDVLKERSAATLKAQRERSKGEAAGFGERHPKTKALVEGVGMALPAAAAMFTGGASLVPTLAASAPAKAGVMGAVRRLAAVAEKGAVIGGVSGALAGLGGDGDLAERVEGATTNARWGMGLGAALPAAVGTIGQGVNMAARGATPAAERELATAGRILTARVPDAQAQLPAWNANVLPFEQMGRGGQSLARAVSAVPGPGQEIAEQVLNARRAEAPARMMRSTARDLGHDGAGYHAKLDELDMQRLVESKPLYEEAFAIGPVQSTKLDDLARRPSVKDAIKKAFKLAMEEGEDARGLGLFDMENPADWVSDVPPTGAVVAGAEKAAARGGLAKAPQGKTLIKFIADNGGVLDEGGDLAMRDPQLWNRGRAYQSRLIGEGGTPEQWAQRAWERGYFPDRDRAPSPAELFEALDDELRGAPRYAREADPRQADRVRMLDEAEEMTYRGGMADDVPSPDDYVGRPEPQSRPVFGQVPTAKTWDYVKRGLDEVIEEQRDPVTKRLPRTDTMRLMDQTRRELRGELVRLNPAYANALHAYTGPSRSMDAQHLGRRLVSGSMDPEDVATGVGMMSKNELDGLKLGMARGLSDLFRKENPQRAIRRFANDAVVQDRLRAGFNDDVAYGRFMDDVLAEAEAQASYNRVLSGSRTTPLREDIDAANEAAGGGAAMFADILERRAAGEKLPRQALNAALRNWHRLRQPGLNNPEVSKILGEVLFKGRPAEEVLQQAVAQKQITVGQARQIADGIAQYSSQSREANREGR